MKSKIYSSSCVKTTTKGRTWIPAFLALGFFMAFPVAELIVMGNWSDLKYAPEYVAALYENLWKEGFLYTGLAVSVFAAFFNGVSGFWYLYSPRKVDFYHSLPVKRRQMFWHRAYVGLLYYAVPYLVNVFLAVCIGAMRGFFSLHLMKLAFFMLVIHLLMYCLCYFAVVLVICVTGTVLMGCLMELALFLYGPILGILVEGYERNFFDCYADRHGGLTEILISYGSPVGICRTFAEQYTSGQYGVQLMVLMLAVLIFGVCACAAFTMRKSERTGKSLIYRFSEPVLRILVTIPAGFGIGYIFLMLPNPKSQTPWWIFGMIIGTILAHGILEIIIGMEFKRFFSHKIELVLTGALVAVCACTMKMDLLGYDMYLPKYDRMEEVALNVEGLADYETYNMIEKKESGSYAFISNYDDVSGYGFTGAGMNQEIYDALEKIVKASASITENSKTELEMYNRAHFLQVRYQLKSGSAVYRNYLVSSENLKELLIACYDQGTIKEKKYSFRVIEPEYLDSVNGIFADGENYVLFQDEPEKMHALLEAFLKDVQEADAESLVDVPCVKLDFFYEDVPMERRYSSNVPAIQSKENYCHSVNVYPQFKRTLALLEETGYALSVEDVEISEVKTIYIEAETEEGRELSEEFSYSTKEEIEALKECLVSSDLMPSWVEEDITLYSVKVSNSVSGEKEFWKVRKDREPDFLIKDRK